MSTIQLHEWIAALKLKSEYMHVVSLFTSPMRKVAPAIVLGSPRVTSAQQARQSSSASRRCAPCAAGATR